MKDVRTVIKPSRKRLNVGTILKSWRTIVFIVSLLLEFSAYSTTWYASPSATANGNGSIGNPWRLSKALVNTSAIIAGDTIYLRDGTYAGGYKSIIGTGPSYITVGAYPGERAIITDGVWGILGTDMTTSTSSIVITNSQDFLPGTVVSIDSENVYLSSTSDGTNWLVAVRGWNGTTNTAHSAGALCIPFSRDIIAHTGTNVIFRDLEITSVMTTNRQANYAFRPGGGIELLSPGKGNKIVNCLIYNTGHPGIGFWNQQAGGELSGNLIWGVGVYDYTENFQGAPRGSAIYSQNVGGVAMINNHINFRDFTSGGKVFGETGPVSDFKFQSNIVFQCTPSLEAVSGSTGTSNTWMLKNVLMGSPALSYVSASNKEQFFVDNILVNGGMQVKETIDSVYTNNIVFMSKGVGTLGNPMNYSSIYINKDDLNTTWDYNTYYLGDGSSQYQFDFTTLDVASVNSQGGGSLRFNSDGTNAWPNWSGFDQYSVYASTWPTNYLSVTVNSRDYDANVFHVAVVSTSGQTNVTLDLSSIGFATGNTYTLRDAQNYFTVIGSGTYTSGSINLPLNLTNVSAITGTLTHLANEHTNVDYPMLFNAFVLSRSAETPAFKTVGNATIGNGSF